MLKDLKIKAKSPSTKGHPPVCMPTGLTAFIASQSQAMAEFLTLGCSWNPCKVRAFEAPSAQATPQCNYTRISREGPGHEYLFKAPQATCMCKPG